MAKDRNEQKQAWLNLKGLIRLREYKIIKPNGKIETDAEVFDRVIAKLEKKFKKDMDNAINLKYDKRSLY